jgi:predicted nucleic acid-binding protein
MTGVLVDSNVLLDILTEDAVWLDWSLGALAGAADRGRVVINPIIYAEASLRFSRVEDFEAALPRMALIREPLPYAAGFLAGKAFVAYRRRGGARTAPLPDFFIGAHALVAGYRVLTRDPRRYRRDFPTLSLIAPPRSV